MYVTSHQHSTRPCTEQVPEKRASALNCERTGQGRQEPQERRQGNLVGPPSLRCPGDRLKGQGTVRTVNVL